MSDSDFDLDFSELLTECEMLMLKCSDRASNWFVPLGDDDMMDHVSAHEDM